MSDKIKEALKAREEMFFLNALLNVALEGLKKIAADSDSYTAIKECSKAYEYLYKLFVAKRDEYVALKEAFTEDEQKEWIAETE